MPLLSLCLSLAQGGILANQRRAVIHRQNKPESNNCCFQSIAFLLEPSIYGK